MTEDGRFLVVTIWTGTDRRNRVHLLDLARPGRGPIPLFDRQDARYDFLGSDGERLWFLTDRDAPMGRVVLAHAGRPEELTEVLPEANCKLQSASLAG